jgi:NADPH:quinone reductase-like Zn-dependent oxidoreductase
MEAVVWTRYGPPEGLELAEVLKPTPRRREILIRVRATTVAAGDAELRGLRFSLGLRLAVRLLMGLRRPRRKILGQEFAGEVEAVGSGVTAFRPGDRVYGTTGFGFGAYAEYICQPERSHGRALALIPGRLSFEEAAAAPTGGLEALHFLRAAGVLTGRTVLINGGGGGIGTFAIQLARELGAEVTGVDGPTKQDLMRSLGAVRVVDFTRHDFSTPGESYDVLLDVVGSTSFSKSLEGLRPRGSYLVANPSTVTMLRGLRSSRRGGRKVVARASRQRTADLLDLGRMLETGRIRSIIDRTFPLEQIREAHRFVESGLVRGKVVIRVP